MARCCGLWFGGSSYALPDPSHDLEQFNSLKDAVSTFESRADHDHYYPCVDKDTSEMHVYFGTTYHENGPDRIIRFGPKGGVKVERG